MALSYRLAGSSDASLFERIAGGVFDHSVELSLLADFLNDPRHHLAVADDDGLIVGFVSAVDYVHPDKPRQLWINEIGVAPDHRGAGVGKKLMQMMIEIGQSLGCTEVWVLTDEKNEPARALYESSGLRSCGAQLIFSRKLD